MHARMHTHTHTHTRGISLHLCFPLQVFVYMIFVAQMAFHAKISDPAIGGTYMTLLNTVANLGMAQAKKQGEKITKNNNFHLD